jgi:hypothetical protein
MPRVFSPIYHFKENIALHNLFAKLLEDAGSYKDYCTLRINGINVAQET